MASRIHPQTSIRLQVTSMMRCAGILQQMALDLVQVEYRVLAERPSKTMARQISLNQISTLKSLRQAGNLSQSQRNRRRQNFIITLSTHLAFGMGCDRGHGGICFDRGDFEFTHLAC